MIRYFRHTGLAGAFILAVSGLSLFTSWAVAGSPSADEGGVKVPGREVRKKNPVPATSTSLMTGQQVFTANCQVCHGAAGKGDGVAATSLERRPADLTHRQVSKQTDGALFWKITGGNRPMPAFEKLLPDESRWNVINYARSLSRQPATAPSATQPAPAAAP